MAVRDGVRDLSVTGVWPCVGYSADENAFFLLCRLYCVTAANLVTSQLFSCQQREHHLSSMLALIQHKTVISAGEWGHIAHTIQKKTYPCRASDIYITFLLTPF